MVQPGLVWTCVAACLPSAGNGDATARERAAGGAFKRRRVPCGRAGWTRAGTRRRRRTRTTQTPIPVRFARPGRRSACAACSAFWLSRRALLRWRLMVAVRYPPRPTDRPTASLAPLAISALSSGFYEQPSHVSWDRWTFPLDWQGRARQGSRCPGPRHTLGAMEMECSGLPGRASVQCSGRQWADGRPLLPALPQQGNRVAVRSEQYAVVRPG